jgi:N-acetylmuramoyl-L-alanine amidase
VCAPFFAHTIAPINDISVNFFSLNGLPIPPTNPVVIGIIDRYAPPKPVLTYSSIESLFRVPAYLSRVVACVMLLLMVAGPAHSAAPAAGWEVTKIEGREYVSVDSIKRFYNFANMTRTGSSVVLENAKVEMKLKVGCDECLMNNVKFVFSHPVAPVGEKVYISRIDLAKLIDPVLRPNFIQNAGDFRTVVLDPGHGGKDCGSSNPLGTEAMYNLKLAGMVKKQLEAKGFKVVMTRNTNEYLTLQERVNFANAIKENAIYISIHFNSGGSSARGIETFTLSPPGVPHYDHDFKAADLQSRAGNEHDSANIALATSVHGSILRRLGTNTLDRGIKRARFSVLSGVRHPAILFEGGFLSHSYEARLIEKEAYQNALAGGLVDAIGKYRFAVSRMPGAAQAN